MTSVSPLSPDGFCTAFYPTFTSGRPTLLPAAAATWPTWQAWTELTASCPIDAEGVLVAIRHGDAGTAYQTFHLEIGVGSAGNEHALIGPIRHFDNYGVIAQGKEETFYLPVRFRKGVRVVARQMTSVANARIGVAVAFVRGGSGFPAGYSRAPRISGSVDGGGVINGNTLSAWSDNQSSCPTDFAGIMISALCDITGIDQAFYLDVGVGSAGNERIIARHTSTYRFAAAYDCMSGCFSLGNIIPVSIKKGSRVAVRGKGTNASSSWSVDIIGLVP